MKEVKCFSLMTPSGRSTSPPRWSTPSRPDADELDDVPALDRFVTAWGLTGSRRSDSAELDRVRALRPRLRALWHADEDGVVAAVNGMLREARALPQLVTHDDWGYHLHATPPTRRWPTG